MKTTARVMVVVFAMATVGLAEPVKPAPELSPHQEDAMLRKLMAEMLKESEEDQKEMEAPVELPTLNAPELQRLMRGMGLPATPAETRWMIGVRLNQVHLHLGDGDRLVVRDVMAGSPAQEAGLKVADVLLDVNGIRLRDHEMLVDLLQVVRDQELVLGVRRGEENLKVKMTPRESKVPGRDAPMIEMQKIEVPPKKVDRDDEVLEELRGMRGLMEEMLKELKKQSPKVRRVPTPPRN